MEESLKIINVLVNVDWERAHILEQIYITEERELLFKELNERQPAKIVVKKLKMNNVYDKELFYISEIN